MKNRIASLFLVFALLMSLCNFAVARDNPITVRSGGAERFTDVPADHWAYAYINKVVGSGLFNGKTATTFEPSSAMTRSQFVLVMDRMEGMQSLEGVPTQTIFPDVAPTRLAAGPIQWANQQGFVLGFGDGTFKPDSPITRGQFAALIYRYINAKHYTKLHVVDPEPAQFTDANSVSQAFVEAVEFARLHGLLTGYSDGTVRASNPITRAAIAAILARFLDLVVESGYTPLLDAIDNGDSGDSGDSGNTPATPVDTNYDEIKMNVSTHGTSKITGVTRNGTQVTDGDLQPGDVVTLTHTPDSGYEVSVRVRDAKGRTVKVTTRNNVSTFTLPENLPVTVTVTYSRISSGGGGGSGGSGGGIPLPNVPTTTPYYLRANATATPAEGGTVVLVNELPTAYPASTAHTPTQLFSRANQTGDTVIGYAMLFPATGWKVDSVKQGDTELTVSPLPIGDAQVQYVQISGQGGLIADSAPVVNVTANFVLDTQSATETKWTLNVADNAENSGAKYQFFRVPDDKPATGATFAPADITAPNAQLVWSTVSAGEQSVYLLIDLSGSQFKFANENAVTVDDGSKVDARGTPSDTFRAYQITRTLTENQAATTNVTVNLAPTNPVNHTHDVNVAAEVRTPQRNADNPLLAKASATVSDVEVNVATMGDTVTVTAPATSGTGYNAHNLDTAAPITVKTASNADVTVTAKDNGPDTYSWTFVMPDEAVNVTVYYKEVDDPALTYAVKYEIVGAGSFVLNVAGVDYSLSSTESTGERTLELDAASLPASESAYVAKYGDSHDFKLPLYLTSIPVAAEGFKYNETSSQNASVYTPQKDEATGELQALGNEFYVVEKNGTLTVKVVFDEIKSYGYNLTILGAGTVTGTFGSTPFTHANSDETAPKTFSSGMVVMDSAPSITINAPDGFTLATSGAHSGEYVRTINGVDYIAEKPVVNGNASDYGTPVALSDTNNVADVVVEIHKADRVAYSFTVNVTPTTGKVTLNAASGRIITSADFINPTGDNLTDAKNALDKGNAVGKTSVDHTGTDNSKTYYAFEGTIVTIVPQTTATSKVMSIDVKAGSTTLYDVLSTAGFSFQLNGQTTAEVKFGTLNQNDAYSVLLQAPYTGTIGGKDLHSQSAKIQSGTNGSKISEVLYSLNNGQLSGPVTSTTGIENSFGLTPDNLTKVLDYFLTQPSMDDPDNPGTKITGAQSLEKMLVKSVRPNISKNLPAMIDAKKAELTGNPATVNQPITQQMTTAQNAYEAAPTGNGPISVADSALPDTVKASIIQTILSSDAGIKQLYDAGTITANNFAVTLSVTPLLSASKETADASGKSVESQLQRFVNDYLNKLAVDDFNVDADISVAVTGGQNITITISATADFGPNQNNWPKLKDGQSMLDYLDQIQVWGVVVPTITVSYTNPVTQSLETVERTAAPTLYLLSQFESVAKTINNLLSSNLGAVDNAVSQSWNSTISGMLGTTGRLNVDMGQVLTKEMFDQVVEEQLQNAIETLVGNGADKKPRIESLGDGAATRAAFMNLYRDFVVFDNTTPDALLSLKTKADNQVIGKVDGSNLVITLDMNAILRDLAQPTDQTAYENLLDLLVAFRDGVSTDIRETSEKNGQSSTSQTVISSMIQSQIARNKGKLVAVKWGQPIGNGTGVTRGLRAAEQKELADLVADLIMNSKLDDTLDGKWQAFEQSGYSSVELSLPLDSDKRGNVAPVINAFQYAGLTTSNKLDVGFKVTQEIKEATN